MAWALTLMGRANKQSVQRPPRSNGLAGGRRLYRIHWNPFRNLKAFRKSLSLFFWNVNQLLCSDPRRTSVRHESYFVNNPSLQRLCENQSHSPGIYAGDLKSTKFSMCERLQSRGVRFSPTLSRLGALGKNGLGFGPDRSGKQAVIATSAA